MDKDEMVRRQVQGTGHLVAATRQRDIFNLDDSEKGASESRKGSTTDLCNSRALHGHGAFWGGPSTRRPRSGGDCVLTGASHAIAAEGGIWIEYWGRIRWLV